MDSTEITEREGMFTASRISELLAEGTGRTRQNYIFDIAHELVEGRSDFQTKEMLHGTINQMNGFDLAFKPIHGGQWFDKFLIVNDMLGASPDIIDLNFVADIKCPYYIHTFFEQRDRLPKKYIAQSMVQMMAAKVDVGYMCLYLTKPETFGQDDWVEYPFSIEERTYIHTVQFDKEMEANILKAVEDNYPLIGQCVKLLNSAVEYDDEQFYRMQYMGTRFLKLKDTNWLNKETCIKHKSIFYTQK